MKQVNHEFYELVHNYELSRRRLLECEAAIATFESEYRINEDQVWITDTVTTTVKVGFMAFITET